MMTNEKRVENPRLSDQLAEEPKILLDAVIQQLHLGSDAALSRALGVTPPIISKIRNAKMPVGYAILVRILETTDLTMRELYELANMPQSASAPATMTRGMEGKLKTWPSAEKAATSDT